MCWVVKRMSAVYLFYGTHFDLDMQIDCAQTNDVRVVQLISEKKKLSSRLNWSFAQLTDSPASCSISWCCHSTTKAPSCVRTLKTRQIILSVNCNSVKTKFRAWRQKILIFSFVAVCQKPKHWFMKSLDGGKCVEKAHCTAGSSAIYYTKSTCKFAISLSLLEIDNLCGAEKNDFNHIFRRLNSGVNLSRRLNLTSLTYNLNYTSL